MRGGMDLNIFDLHLQGYHPADTVTISDVQSAFFDKVGREKDDWIEIIPDPRHEGLYIIYLVEDWRTKYVTTYTVDPRAPSPLEDLQHNIDLIIRQYYTQIKAQSN